MCSQYETVTRVERLKTYFQVDPPADTKPDELKTGVWPGYAGVFVRRPAPGSQGGRHREAVLGRFGLVPSWATDLNLWRRTYNARSESVQTKPSFKQPWADGQFCLVLAESIVEPDWRSGRCVLTRISHKDGTPMAIAGLWNVNEKLGPQKLESFTMLTMNADDHPVFRNFHRPTDEKRMVVFIHPEFFDDWLSAPAQEARHYMRPCDPEGLKVEPLTNAEAQASSQKVDESQGSLDF